MNHHTVLYHKPPMERTRTVNLRSTLLLTSAVALAACEEQVPTSANILPGDTIVLAGTPAPFGVDVFDQNGNLMSGVEGGTWDATGPLDVDAAGVVTGREYGQGTLRYTVEGVVAEARILVNIPLTLSASLHYLTQTIQRPGDLIPLIPGRDALLRLFVAVDQDHWYRGGLEVRVTGAGMDTVLARSGILRVARESELNHSYNLLVPGDRIEDPSLSLDVTYDPNGLHEGISGRETLVYQVAGLPRFDLMVVPTVSSRHPGHDAITEWARPGLTFDHDKLWASRKLLPVSVETAQLTVHGVLDIDYRMDRYNGWIRLLNHMGTLRQAEGRRDYYLAVLKYAGGGTGGVAYLGVPQATSIDNPTTMSHELGHSMSLQHAPCNVSGDPNFPHPDGEIGQWAIDLDDMSLKPPHFKDHMGYCSQNNWVSDYFFDKALRFRDRRRMRTVREPVLILSGDITGGVMEPAFALDEGTPDSADPDGTHLLAGFRGGEVVFEHRFIPELLPHIDRLAFHESVPYSLGRDGALDRVTLTGPGVVSMTLLPDNRPRTVFEIENGQVVRISTDHRGPVPVGALHSTGLPR